MQLWVIYHFKISTDGIGWNCAQNAQLAKAGKPCLRKPRDVDVRLIRQKNAYLDKMDHEEIIKFVLCFKHTNHRDTCT